MAGETGNPDWIEAQKYKTPEALQAKIDEVFAMWDAKYKPYTMSGLALELGFKSRTSLLDYRDKGGEFGAAIQRAKIRVEQDVEQRLMAGKSANGAIFSLQNNFGWVQRVETRNENLNNNKGKLEIEFVDGTPDGSGEAG